MDGDEICASVAVDLSDTGEERGKLSERVLNSAGITLHIGEQTTWFNEIQQQSEWTGDQSADHCFIPDIFL